MQMLRSGRKGSEIVERFRAKRRNLTVLLSGASCRPSKIGSREITATETGVGSCCRTNLDEGVVLSRYGVKRGCRRDVD